MEIRPVEDFLISHLLDLVDAVSADPNEALALDATTIDTFGFSLRERVGFEHSGQLPEEDAPDVFLGSSESVEDIGKSDPMAVLDALTGYHTPTTLFGNWLVIGKEEKDGGASCVRFQRADSPRVVEVHFGVDHRITHIHSNAQARVDTEWVYQDNTFVRVTKDIQ